MKVGLVALLLLAVASVATACGGDDEQAAEIRTQRGLAVALAAQAGQSAQDRASGEGDTNNGTGGAGQPASLYPDATRGDAAAGALLQPASEGLTVTGYGMASADADSALLELYFSSSDAYPRTEPSDPSGGTGSSGAADTPAASPISESDLQPVIDAITGQGVAREDIEYIGGSYYDPYYGSATLRVTVREIDRLTGVQQAATGAAAALTNVFLQGTYVSYTITNCDALEIAAMKAAVEDAAARGDALAEAVGVTRGAVTGATSYAYSPFGGTACTAGYVGPYPMGGVAYAEGQAREVQVYASVTVTYAMQ